MKNSFLQNICNEIIIKSHLVKGLGLQNGTMGIALFLCLYSEIENDEKVRSKALDILLSFWNTKLYQLPLNFYTGFSGVGWSFGYLIRKDIMEYNEGIESVLDRIDRRFIGLNSSLPVQIDASGLFAKGIYALMRRREGECLEKYESTENLIYLLYDCERFFDSEYECLYTFDQMSFPLLNSLVYYITEAEQLAIFPCKVASLMRKIPDALLRIDSERALVDVVTYNVLSENYLESCPVSDECLSSLSADSVIDNLSKAGFYSLIYNKNIFGRVLDVLERHNINLERLLSGYSLSSLSPTMNGLSGLGYGLLVNKDRSV